MEFEQLAGADGGHGVGAAVVVRKLDFKDIGGPLFDDRSDLSANEALAGEVFEEGDEGEHFGFRHGACAPFLHNT